jgi:hypothetical protein
LNKEKEKENTKRKVNLVSSHSDNENDDGPILACDNNGSAVSEIYRDRDDIESKLRYKPRPRETVIYEEIYIPDVDHD